MAFTHVSYWKSRFPLTWPHNTYLQSRFVVCHTAMIWSMTTTPERVVWSNWQRVNHPRYGIATWGKRKICLCVAEVTGFCYFRKRNWQRVNHPRYGVATWGKRKICLCVAEVTGFCYFRKRGLRRCVLIQRLRHFFMCCPVFVTRRFIAGFIRTGCVYANNSRLKTVKMFAHQRFICVFETRKHFSIFSFWRYVSVILYTL
jgi:hypothetical protein